MTRKIRLITALAACVILWHAPALAFQPADDETPANIVEQIVEGSGGDIVIDIPDDVLEQILSEFKEKEDRGKAPTKRGARKRGYRVQVFLDGNNQATLESRAKARGAKVLARFPKYMGQVYTYSSAPNWICRVGNFETEEEANRAFNEIRRAFPEFGAGMRVVATEIIVH